MRESQPSILTCDQCGFRTTETKAGSWVHVERPHWVDFRYRSDIDLGALDFCSLQHAGLFLLGLADQHEVLGAEAMVALGRSSDRPATLTDGEERT